VTTGGPPPDILQRYSPTTMRDHAESCHYDNLREHGFPPGSARDIAQRAAEHQAKALERGAGSRGGPAAGAPGGRRLKRRVPFPWEKGDDKESSGGSEDGR